jgi:hypothetical protein
MDPIRNKITPAGPGNIQGPQQTPATDAASGPSRKFDIGATEGATQANAAQRAQDVARPAFTEMAACIKSAVDRSLTRDQARDELIDHEAHGAFGDSATPEMSAAIGEAFRNDPHLSQLFNQLYAKAVASK